MKSLIALTIVACATSFAAAPCKDKRRAMHAVRAAHKQCNKSWQDSLRGTAADPTDDCSAKQVELIQAVKELKTCLVEAKAAKK